MFNNLPIWIYDDTFLKYCAETQAYQIFNDMMIKYFWERVKIKE